MAFGLSTGLEAQNPSSPNNPYRGHDNLLLGFTSSASESPGSEGPISESIGHLITLVSHGPCPMPIFLTMSIFQALAKISGRPTLLAVGQCFAKSL